jgi:hypothetical protein
MAETVEGWLRDQQNTAATMGVTTPPEPMPDWDWQVAVPLTPEEVFAPATPAERALSLWPAPIGGRWLGLVVRQWALEGGSEMLANQLVGHRGWLEEVERLRTLLRNPRQQKLRDAAARIQANSADVRSGRPALPPLGRTTQARPSTDRGRLSITTGTIANLREENDAILAQRLRWRGLPDTPTTVAHLRAVAGGGREPLPTRGLLVTTFIYLQDRLLQHKISTDDTTLDEDVTVAITGSLALATGPLLHKAQEIALLHRNWLPTLGMQHPFADRKEQKKHHPRSFQSRGKPLDYLTEALDEDQVAKLIRGIRASVRAPGQQPSDSLIEQRISAYLKHGVSNRVSKRRRKAGLETTPPAGWTDRAREVLRGKIAAALLAK